MVFEQSVVKYLLELRMQYQKAYNESTTALGRRSLARQGRRQVK